MGDYFLNVTMLNGYIGAEYIDGAHWYLTYLLLFNVIIAIIAFFEKKYGANRKKLLLGLLFVNIITNIISMYYTPFRMLNKLLGGEYLMFVLIGIFLREIFENKESIVNKKTILLFVLPQIINIVTQKLLVFIGIEIFILIFIFAIKEKIKLLDSKGISYLGDLSYITYLLHQNVGYQMLLGMTAIFNFYSPIYIFMVMLIVLLLSSIIYRYYEVPIQKKIKLKEENLCK